MTINLSDNSPRNSYTVNQGATASTFEVQFAFFDNDDLNVYVDGTLKTLTTHYTTSDDQDNTVAHVQGEDGYIHFTSGNAVTGATGGSLVVITRDIDLDRVTDFPTSGPFDVASLNTELDRMIGITADLKDDTTRALVLNDSDAAADLVLPLKSSRLGKVLGFNSSSGNVEAVSQLNTASIAATNTVAVGGSSTASVAVTANNAAFTFGIPTGATGATGATGPRGSDAGLDLTWSSSTSDADPGAGKLAFNNGTVSSVDVIYVDDVDDHSVTISSFVQSWDDVSNSTARGILLITKEGTSSTYAMFKVSGGVTNASGYSKVAVTHVVSNGTFSNGDGITVQFSYSGADSTVTIDDVTALAIALG